MYAVIESGGKQYRVAPGDVVEVESIEGEIGKEINLGRVLALVSDGAITLGDAVKSAVVKGSIAAHGRGKKVIVFKFKRKKQYKKTIGHRQNFTAVKINEIAV